MTARKKTIATNGRRSSVDRIANIKRLLVALSEREMTFREIGQFLEFTTSGTRKYVIDLREAGAILIRAGGANVCQNATVYRSADPEYVAEFLAMLDAGGRLVSNGAETRASAKVDSTRHLHILGDDEPSEVRIRRNPARYAIKADSFPLHAAFFGRLA